MDELVAAGMNVARLNMSHGDHNEHLNRLSLVREAALRAGKRVASLADLQGPKIRCGRFTNGREELVMGQTFTITIDDIMGDNTRCSTTFKGLPGDVTPGEIILIDDGKIQLDVTEVTERDVVCVVTVPGIISNNKGINLPGVAVSVPALSEKDEADLRWALSQGIDVVALSFVRSADDVVRVHEIMAEEGRKVPVVAKLEKPQAIDNLQAIIDAFDAVMVARGDLGVELPLEDVPLVQKRIIRAARRWAKPVIVATQMLESMIDNPRPTRAEASDVANAIFDGADAVMLSGETSVGQFPIETVQTMARIIEETERHGHAEISKIEWDIHTTGGVVCQAATDVARKLNCKVVAAFTESGDSAKRLARIRPETPIIAFTPNTDTCQQMMLSWGVETVLTPKFVEPEDMIVEVNRWLIENGRAEPGDMVVIVRGSPLGVAGTTNSLRVHLVRKYEDMTYASRR